MAGCAFHGTATPIWLTHTQTHTAVIITKPDCKTSLAVCQTASCQTSCHVDPQTYRQVCRFHWKHSLSGGKPLTVPFLSTLLFLYLVSLIHLSALPFSLQLLFTLFPFLSLTSPLWSSRLKSQSLSQLASGHRPSSTMAQCQASERKRTKDEGREMSTLKATVIKGGRRGSLRKEKEKGWQVWRAGGQNKLSGSKTRTETKEYGNWETEDNNVSG